MLHSVASCLDQHCLLSPDCLNIYMCESTNCVQPKKSSGPEVVKLCSCSTQLSKKLALLLNLKLLTIANSFLLNIADHENFFANKYENANY